jgi:hypothetical protein
MEITENQRLAWLQQPTVTIPQFGAILRISRGLAYKVAEEYGIIEVGKRKLVPTAPLRRKLGIEGGAA